MANDPVVTTLRRTVINGERMRRHLIGVSYRTDAVSRAGVGVELAMFYGQAFGAVHGLLFARTESPQFKVLLEAGRGIAMFDLWMHSDIPLEASEHIALMDSSWQRIVGRV
jgi:hypothetical protein